MSDLVVQEFTSFEPLSALRRDWDELVWAQNFSPAETYEWLSTLWELHNTGRELLILVVRDAQGVTGIAPLVQETERRKGIRVRLLKMLGSFHALHGTPILVGRRKEETMQAVFDHVHRRHEGWTLWFTSYQTGDKQEAAFSSSFLGRGYPLCTSVGVRSPYLPVEGSWEEKVRTLQPRFRTALRSREKRLREKGAVELRFLDEGNHWEEGLEAIREIEQDSWKVEAGTAITVQNFQWHFYRRYAPIAAKAGTLRIPVLFVEGEPIAYDYALYENGIYYLLKTSYRNKWSDSYPGFVLRKLLVEWTYALGGREIDFLGNDEDWKMKWTSSVREHRDCYVFNRNLAGRYLHGLHRVRRLLTRAG